MAPSKGHLWASFGHGLLFRRIGACKQEFGEKAFQKHLTDQKSPVAQKTGSNAKQAVAQRPGG